MLDLVITVNLSAGGGTPDPVMAKRLVDLTRAFLADTAIIERIIEQFETSTASTLPVGRVSVAVVRHDPTVYGVTE